MSLHVGQQVWVVNTYVPSTLPLAMRAFYTERYAGSILAMIVEWHASLLSKGTVWYRVANEELHFDTTVLSTVLREFKGWPVRPQTGVEQMPGVGPVDPRYNCG